MTHRISLKLILLLSLNVLFTAARRIPYNRQSNSDLDTLSSLFIVHRHGDRTIISTFPNDPYVNESYWPDGWGELTEVRAFHTMFYFMV